MSLVDDRQRVFLETKRRKISKLIRKQGGTKKIFEKFAATPSDNGFRDFLVDVNYGPCKDLPLLHLGEAVGFEILGDAFKHGFRDLTANVEADGLSQFNFEKESEYSEFVTKKFIARGNVYTETVLFIVHTFVEKRILPLLDHELLERAVESPNNTDQDSGIALKYVYDGLARPDSIPSMDSKSPFILRSDRALSLTQWIALPSTFEELDRLKETAEKHHGVSGHQRTIKSGNVIWVTPHERRNPKGAVSTMLDMNADSYIVYFAYDSNGLLRYVGEGTMDRPRHVNSGASHNSKLNEHYFLAGPMKIRLVHEGLSKDYAKAIESFYIKKFGEQLWNVAENVSGSSSRFETDWLQYKLDMKTLLVVDLEDPSIALESL